MIKIDGDYLEGGGQILRTALALSIITQKPFSIDNIRKGRSNPGLKAQHLSCIKALMELTKNKVKVTGNQLGSTSLLFCPAKITKSKLKLDIGTAGSITLLLQCILLPLVLGEKKISMKIIGGTDTKWSPTFEYFKQIIIPHLSKYAKIEMNLLKRGFYPKGQGEVEVKINPYKIDNLDEINIFNSYELVFISGKSFASKDLMDAQVAERQAMAAEQFLKQHLNFQHIKINSEYNDSVSTGSGITLWATINATNINSTIELDEESSSLPLRLGSDFLGERNIKAEEVGKKAAEHLFEEINASAPIDSHLADNLIPYLGIMGGSIKVTEISNHTLTNIYVTELFVDKKFRIKKEEKIISV